MGPEAKIQQPIIFLQVCDTGDCNSKSESEVRRKFSNAVLLCFRFWQLGVQRKVISIIILLYATCWEFMITSPTIYHHIPSLQVTHWILWGNNLKQFKKCFIEYSLYVYNMSYIHSVGFVMWLTTSALLIYCHSLDSKLCIHTCSSKYVSPTILWIPGIQTYYSIHILFFLLLCSKISILRCKM